MPNLKLETYKSKKTGVIYDYTDADAQSQLTGIKDGTSIDSFADVESALAGLVDWSSYAKTGAINLLENKATSQTLNNVTFTVGADKTITATNTANATTFLQLNGHVNLKAGDYYLSQGVITHDDEIRMQILKVASGSPLIALIGGTGSEVAFTLTEDTDCKIVLRIGNGKNPNGMVFKPMITRLPNLPYAPYAMTNEELTVKPPKLVKSANLQANTNTAFDGIKGHIYQVVCAHPYEQTDSMYLVTLFDAAGTVTAVKDNVAITVSQSNNVITVASTKSTWVKIIDLGSYN